MPSDALQKLRHALHYVEHTPGSRFANLKEAYLRWLVHANETTVPQTLLLDFRRIMQDVGELAFLNGPLSESRAIELMAELKKLEQKLGAV